MKTRKLGSRVLVSLLLTYTIVIFLPICAWVLSLGQYSRTITTQAHELNQSQVKTLCEAVDAKLERIQPACLAIAADSHVRKLAQGQSHDMNTHITETMALLSKAVARDPSIESMYLYFRDGDYIISDSTKVSSDLYYSIVSSTENISRESWMDYLTQTESLSYHFLPGRSTSGTVFCYMPVATTGSGERIMATMVVKLHLNMLSDLVESLNMTQSIVVIHSADGELLFTNQSNVHEALEETQGHYVSSVVTSLDSGWRFASYVPKSSFNAQLDGLWRYTLILAVGAVFLCLATTAYGMRRNYHPLADLVTMLESALKRRRGSNEYEYLRDSIDSLIDTNHESSRLLAQQVKQMRRDCVEKLLLGASRFGDRLPEHLFRLGLEFASDQYAVIVMDYTPDKTAGQDAPEPLLHPPALGDHFYGYSVQIDGRAVFLVDATQQTSTQLREKALALYGVLRVLSPALIMAVSRVQQGETGIANAYNEAISALEYTMALGGEPFLCYDDIVFDNASRYYFPPEEERALMNAVSTGDKEQALSLAQGIWAINQRSASARPALLRLLHHSFLSALMKVVCEPSSGLSEEGLLEEIALADQNKWTPSQLKSSCETAIANLCDAVKAAADTGGEDLFERIMDYIRTHYHECDLDIGRICEEFSCSRTRLFYLFKERCSSGVLNIINTTRMEAAKDLIAMGKSISDVALEVGYSNTGSFLRVFKRHENMTPSQYREALARQA